MRLVATITYLLLPDDLNVWTADLRPLWPLINILLPSRHCFSLWATSTWFRHFIWHSSHNLDQTIKFWLKISQMLHNWNSITYQFQGARFESYQVVGINNSLFLGKLANKLKSYVNKLTRKSKWFTCPLSNTIKQVEQMLSTSVNLHVYNTSPNPY